MVAQYVKAWHYDLTTYQTEPGFRRLKAKASGNSLVSPDGLIQSSVRVFVKEPATISTGKHPNPEYDSIYVVHTLWMNEHCFVYVHDYPTGAVVAFAVREREKDAVEAVMSQLDAVDAAVDHAK